MGKADVLAVGGLLLQAKTSLRPLYKTSEPHPLGRAVPLQQIVKIGRGPASRGVETKSLLPRRKTQVPRGL